MPSCLWAGHQGQKSVTNHFKRRSLEPAFGQIKAKVYPIANLNKPFDDVSRKNAVTRARPFPKRLAKHGFLNESAQDAGLVYTAVLPLRDGWVVELSHSDFPAATRYIEADDSIEICEVSFTRGGDRFLEADLPLPLKHYVYGVLKALTK